MGKDDSQKRDSVSSASKLIPESKAELYVERALELFREGWRAHWVWRYGFAVLMVLLAVLARQEMGMPGGVIGRFVTFYPAVLLAAVLGGMGPGIAATVLSAAYVFAGVHEPGGEFSLLVLGNVVGMSVFVMMGMSISGLAGYEEWSRKRYRERMEEQARLLRKEKEAAEEAKKNWEMTFNTVPDPVMLLDLEQRVVQANEATATLLDAEMAEILGKHCYELMHETDEPHKGCPFQQMLRTNKEARRDVWEPRLEKTFDVITAPVRDTEGGMRGAVHTVRDVTARLAAEKSLKEREELYRSVVTAMAEGVVVQGADSTIVACNESAERILGRSRKEMTGRTSLDPCWQTIHENGEPFPGEMHPAMVTLRTGQRQSNVIMGIRQGNGERKWISVNCEPIFRNGKKAPEATVTTFADITLRKNAEDAAREASEYARNLIEASVDPLVTISREGKITDVNHATEMVTGVDREKLIGSDFSEYFTEPKKAREGYEEVFAKGEVKDYPLAIRHSTGRVTEVLYNATVYRNEKGEVEGVFAAARDITEQKRLEEQLLASQKMEVVGRLAGGMAHEFNNILAIILGNVEMAEELFPREDSLSKFLTAIERAAGRAARLTRQLLAFSRKQVLQPVVLNLNDTVVELSKMVRRLIPENIEVSLNLGVDLGMVRVDPMQVDQVLVNLVLNARDAMPQGGKLTVSTANAELSGGWGHSPDSVIPGKYVMIAIADTGIGMDEETKAHIFEPFFTTKAPGMGTGLGLSIIDGIVKQSGGYVWVYSELGKGTIFKVYLPRVEGWAESKETEEPGVEATAKGSETILVVEDEPELAETARMVLEGSGYRVWSAASGEQALKLAELCPNRVDLLLTDVILKTAMDGTVLAERLSAVWPKLKVIYMSGYSDALIRQGEAAGSGAKVLEKPFSAATLRRKVREALGSERGSRQERLRR